MHTDWEHAGCLNCGLAYKHDEVNAILHSAKIKWGVCEELLGQFGKGILGRGQVIESIEKWLETFEESQSAAAGTRTTTAAAAKSKTLLQRMRQSSLKLHSRHILIITAQQLLAELSQDSFKVVTLFRRCLLSISSILPPNHPEIATLSINLVNYIDSCIQNSKTLPAKTLVAMKKERKDLLVRARNIRQLSLGYSHPLTLSVKID